MSAGIPLLPHTSWYSLEQLPFDTENSKISEVYLAKCVHYFFSLQFFFVRVDLRCLQKYTHIFT